MVTGESGAGAEAKSGLDLHLGLQGKSGREIDAGLRALVSQGRLPVGTRLPAARALASDLGVARNTVGEAYARLAAEGWLETRVGAGTWVAAIPHAEIARVIPAESTPLLELRGGLVDAGDFPRAQWSTHVRAAIADLPAAAFGYPHLAGVAALRDSLAGYLARTRGAVAAPADVFVGGGFADLLALTSRALRARGGRRVAVEEYGHQRHRDIIEAAGLEIVPLPVDDEGADAESLAHLDVAAVLLTPAHQFPTGVPLSPVRRRAVVHWARATGGVVIEDDYDGEFRYDRRSIGALQSLAPDHVMYVGTASKALAPAIGLAWAVTPAWLHDDLVTERERGGGSPAALHQHALAGFIDSFEYDRAVRRRRAAFRSRRDLLARLLAERAPRASIDGLAAGLQCLVALPSESLANDAVRRARERGIAIEALSAYRMAPADKHSVAPAGVVVGYGAPAASRAEHAVTVLVDAIRAALDADVAPAS